jgi:hypothetical protein
MRVDLRQGGRTLGTLIIEDNRNPLFEHELSFEQLRVRPRVSPADENGNSLKVIEGRLDENVGAVLLDGSGSKMLTVRKDTFGFLDVEDPKRLAGIRAVSVGAGSTGGKRIVAGGLILELGPFDKARIFGTRVLDLYKRVDGWVKDTSLKTERQDHSVTEEPYGSYNIPQLELKRGDGTHVATVVPMGASVIAAEGRIEIVGARDRQPLVYFAAGGPQVNVTIGGGTNPIPSSHPVFRDVKSEGWYWLEDVRLGRARPLDAALFKDLLRAVSDLYEF